MPMPPDQMYAKLQKAITDRAQIAGLVKTGQLTPEDLKDYDDFLKHKHAEYVAQSDAPLEDIGFGKALGRGALKAIDYAPGIMRTAAGAAAALAHGRPDVIKGADFADALLPFRKNAPPVAEWRHRLGYGEGPSLSDAFPDYYTSKAQGSSDPFTMKKGGMLDPTAGGTFDLAADLALSPTAGAGPMRKAVGLMGLTDKVRNIPKIGGALMPLTDAERFAGLSAKSVASTMADDATRAAATPTGQKIRATGGDFLMDPLGETLQRGGEALYRVPLKAADASAKKLPPAITLGKLPSDYAQESGVWGSMGGMADQMDAEARATARAASNDVARVSAQYPEQQVGKRAARANYRGYLDDIENGGEGVNAAEAQKVREAMSTFFSGLKGKRTIPLPQADQMRADFMARGRAMKGYDPNLDRSSKALMADKNATLAEVKGGALTRAGTGLNDEIHAALDEVEPGLGTQDMLAGRKTGSLMDGAKATRAADKPETDFRRYMFPMALGAAAGGVVGGPNGRSPGAMAGAGAAGLLATPTVQSGLGLLGARYGKGIGNLLRAIAEEQGGEAARQPSPWTLLNDDLQNLGKDPRK